jgi:energy-coupling factor transporter ATP-binding protein EcfA2
MGKTPSSSGWPAWLLFLIAIIAAVAPPSAAFATSLQTITSHPLLAGILLVGYEMLVGLITLIAAFLRKIWDRRVDAWADASAGRMETMVRLLFAGAHRRYRDFFCYEYSDLDMKGISTRGTYALNLEQVFVELRIDPTPAHQASADPIRLPSALHTGTHDIWDYLKLLDQHLVILGPPGSGKTTLLKHLGLNLAQDGRQSKTQARRLPWKVPIFLPLREHSSLLKEQPGYNLVDAVSNQIQKWKQALPREWIERQLQQGRCLVLLDGLDEIAETTLRQQMVDWVQDQMLAYGTNRFVITSRPLGYRSNPLNRVAVLEIQSFTFEQVTRFLRGWYLANEIKRAVRDDPGVRMKAHDGAENLLERLHNTPALFALAVNPLLLTMIATVHLYYGTLPGARITLYKAICEVFFSRRLEVSNSPQELRAEQRQLVMQPLAYALMRQGKREISRQEACQILKSPLQLVGTTQSPEHFLDHLEAISSGLLLEREQNVYSFAHKTFQEYLAMIYIQQNHLDHELLAHVKESWWHETILLFCAQADATSILEACLTQSSHSLEALTLAIDCAEEALTAKTEVKERLYTFLQRGANDTDPYRQRIIAEALLKRRIRQMRPLQADTFVDTSLVTCVEYQLFLLDEQHYGSIVAPDHWDKYTFPQSQGQDALLGVRVENARAFCRWLTERDREGQFYRLPRGEERQMIKRSVGAMLPKDTGYWEEDGTIIWSHMGPSSSLKEQVVIASDLASASDLARRLVHNCNLDLARNSDLNLVSVRVLARDLAFDLARDLDPDPDSDLVRARKLANNLAFYLDSNRDSDLVRAHIRARDLANNLAFYLALHRNLDLAFKNALTIYFLIFFFLRRPKGMLPVYEGILLIKERTIEKTIAP